MTVVREYSINEFALKDQFVTTQESVSAGQSLPSNMLLQGATMRTSTGYGRTATVKAGEDIRPALESLKSAGGGTLILLAGTHRPAYNIVGDSRVNIVGEGIDQTIIDFGEGAYELRYGASTGGANNFKIIDLTIRNSSTTGFVVEDCVDFQIIDVKTEDHGVTGLSILNSYRFICRGVISNNNASSGIRMTANDTDCYGFDFQFCSVSGNGNYGIRLESETTGFLHSFTLFACRAETSNVQNFSVASGGSGTTQTYNYVLNGCHSSTPGTGVYGIDCDGLRYTIIGCTQDVGDLFIIARTDGTTGPAAIIGCTGIGEYDIDDNVSAIGNTVEIGSAVDPLLQFTKYASNRDSILEGNTGGTAVTEKKIYRMKNTSGGTISAGNLVIFKGAANGNEIDTTTIQGDDRVFGMLMTTLDNNEWGPVLVQGYTTQLDINSTTDIAIGDFIGTHTTAGLGMKCSAGDMAIAIALEARTDNNAGVIDALLITPRKI